MMNENQFIVEEIRLSLWLRLKLWLKARKQRKFLYKEFCFNSGIDFPPSDVKHLSFPEFYLVKTRDLEMLQDKENQVIADYLEKYQSLRENIEMILQQKELEQNEIQLYLTKLKQQRSNLKRVLSKCKISTKYLGLQSQLYNLNATIMNTERNLFDLMSDCKKELDRKAQNMQNFVEQTEEIREVFAQRADIYVKSATKKIQDNLHFTNFKIMPFEIDAASAEEILAATTTKTPKKEQKDVKKKK